MRRARVEFLALLILAASAAGQSLCGPTGLTLSTTGGRLGDPYSLTLTGTPSVSGLLAFDLAPGPVATPIGPICLGLTPALQYRPFTLDAAGSFSITGIAPPDPLLNGFGVFTQAAAVDPYQSSGFAVSNGAHPTLRSPRLYWVDRGMMGAPPGFGGPGPVPGNWVTYDALSETVGPVVHLPSFVLDAIAIPALGWIAMALEDGTLMAFDGTTGAVTLNQQLTTNFSGKRLAVDGTNLVVLEQGGWFGPPVLRIISLPSGTPVLAVTLPAPSAGPLLVPPGSGLAYVTLNSTSTTDVVLPVSLSTGSPLPPISLSTGPGLLSTWMLRNGIIYCLMTTGASANIGLNAIDTSLNAAFYPTPVSVPILLTYCGCQDLLLFRAGPGSNGPSLFIRGAYFSSTLLEISTQTLAVTGAPIPIPTDTTNMELSNGGTEWLLTSCLGCAAGGGSPGGPAQTLHTMNPSTHAVTAIGQIPGGFNTYGVVPSASLNKAYIASSGGLVRLDTDPTITMIPLAPLPLAAYQLTVIVD